MQIIWQEETTSFIFIALLHNGLLVDNYENILNEIYIQYIFLNSVRYLTK